LKGRSLYGESPQAKTAPFVPSKVSLPTDVSNAPLLRQLLPRTDAEILERWESTMLRSTGDVRRRLEVMGVPGCHFDPVLQRKPKLYASFVTQCVGTGVIELSLACRTEVGIFFVGKKCGKLRLILDCRRANMKFLEPPTVELVTGEGLSQIEVDMGSGDLEGLKLALGVADVSDCFHRLILDGPLREHFCWPPLSARELGVSRVGEQPVSPETTVWPMQRGLPMGFSWALYFAQRVNSSKWSLTRALRDSHELSDRRGAWVIGSRGSSAHYTYVDNLGVLSGDTELVRSALAEAELNFGADGLELHEVELKRDGGDALGIVLDGVALETRNTMQRFLRIRGGLTAILNRRRLSGWVLEVIVGALYVL
jgi:hypothetical protein